MQSFHNENRGNYQNGYQNVPNTGTQYTIVLISHPPTAVNPLVQTPAIGYGNGSPTQKIPKNKDSETSVYIKWSDLISSYPTPEKIQTEIRDVCTELNIPPEIIDFKFPERKAENFREKQFLFVEFDHAGNMEKAKEFSENFIQRFNRKYGQGTAQRAKEKPQEEYNIYLQPLPYGFKDTDLMDLIKQNLNLDQTVDTSKWSVRVFTVREDKNPVGFCRIEYNKELVEQIKATMHLKKWDEIGIKPHQAGGSNPQIKVKNANAHTGNAGKSYAPRGSASQFAHNSQAVQYYTQLQTHPIQHSYGFNGFNPMGQIAPYAQQTQFGATPSTPSSCRLTPAPPTPRQYDQPNPITQTPIKTSSVADNNFWSMSGNDFAMGQSYSQSQSPSYQPYIIPEMGNSWNFA